MIREQITLEEFIEALNTLCVVDPKAMCDLVNNRVECNIGMLNHPTVQAGRDEQGAPEVGMLGVLNGIFGVFDDGKRKGWGPITARIDEGKCIGFERTKNE